MQGSLGHEPGRGPGGDDTGDSLFAQAVAGLADGGLMFPAPFDLASSAALAKNIDVGRIAEALFAVTAARDTQYVVTIMARVADTPDVGDREIMKTEVNSSHLLMSLLNALCNELESRSLEHPTGE